MPRSLATTKPRHRFPDLTTGTAPRCACSALPCTNAVPSACDRPHRRRRVHVSGLLRHRRGDHSVLTMVAMARNNTQCAPGILGQHGPPGAFPGARATRIHTPPDDPTAPNEQARIANELQRRDRILEPSYALYNEQHTNHTRSGRELGAASAIGCSVKARGGLAGRPSRLPLFPALHNHKRLQILVGSLYVFMVFGFAQVWLPLRPGW